MMSQTIVTTIPEDEEDPHISTLTPTDLSTITYLLIYTSQGTTPTITDFLTTHTLPTLHTLGISSGPDSYLNVDVVQPIITTISDRVHNLQRLEIGIIGNWDRKDAIPCFGALAAGPKSLTALEITVEDHSGRIWQRGEQDECAEVLGEKDLKKGLGRPGLRIVVEPAGCMNYMPM